jgi:hypothetical protein
VATTYEGSLSLATAVIERTAAGDYLPIAGQRTPYQSPTEGDGPALGATVLPTAIAVDSQGRVYVGDRCSIRIITAGQIRTITGNPEVCGDSTGGELAVGARIEHVTALAVDPQGRILATTVGGNSSGLYRIDANGLWTRLCSCFGYSITVDSTNTIYLDGIQRVNLGDGTTTYLAHPYQPDSGDGGPLDQSSFMAARGAALAPDGTLYVGDHGLIRSITGLAAAAVPATQPRNLNAAPSDQAATITWRPPADTGADLPRSYLLTLEPGDTRIAAGGTATTMTVRGLTNGTTYTLEVKARNAAGDGASSQQVTFTPRAPSRLTAAPTAATTAGHPVTLSARLSAGEQPQAGRSLEIQGRLDGTTTWHSLAHATTDNDGRATYQTDPSHNSDFRWRWAGNAASTAAMSPERVVIVRSTVHATSAATGMSAHPVKISGAVFPAAPNARVVLQRYTAHAWQTVARQPLGHGRTFAFVLPAAAGTHRYRVHKPRDSRNGANSSLGLSVTGA